jgi:hypothetical protein
VDRIADPWGARTPFGRGEDWPAREDAQLAEGVSEEDDAVQACESETAIARKWLTTRMKAAAPQALVVSA